MRLPMCCMGTIGRLKSFHHELLHNRGGKPCGTQPHINFRSFQIFGLCLGQCVHINLELRVTFRYNNAITVRYSPYTSGSVGSATGSLKITPDNSVVMRPYSSGVPSSSAI